MDKVKGSAALTDGAKAVVEFRRPASWQARRQCEIVDVLDARRFA